MFFCGVFFSLEKHELRVEEETAFFGNILCGPLKCVKIEHPKQPPPLSDRDVENPDRNTRVGQTPKEKLRISVQNMTPQSQHKRYVLPETSSENVRSRLKSTIGRLGWRFSKFRIKCAVYLVICPSSLLSHHLSRTDICRNTENTVVILRAGLAQFGWTGHLHGRHFDDLLLLVMAKMRAQSKSDWRECVNQTMEAKKTLIRQCCVLFRPSDDIQKCEERCCKIN